MDAGAEERLGRVDVADADQAPGVHQEGLAGADRPRAIAASARAVERRVERLGAEVGEVRVGRRGRRSPPRRRRRTGAGRAGGAARRGRGGRRGARAARAASPAGTSVSRPLMPRWTTSVEPASTSTSRYLLRRRSASTLRPASRRASDRRSSGSRSAGESTSTRSIRRPRQPGLEATGAGPRSRAARASAGFYGREPPEPAGVGGLTLSPERRKKGVNDRPGHPPALPDPAAGPRPAGARGRRVRRRAGVEYFDLLVRDVLNRNDQPPAAVRLDDQPLPGLRVRLRLLLRALHPRLLRSRRLRSTSSARSSSSGAPPRSCASGCARATSPASRSPSAPPPTPTSRPSATTR